MKSMTGFGRGGSSRSERGITINAEISSINRKQLEIRTSLPKELSAFEPLLKRLVGARVSRGSVTVKAFLELSSAAIQQTIRINEPLASAMLKKMGRLADRLDVRNDVGLSELIKFPGVVEINPPDNNIPGLEDAFAESVEKALGALDEMRSHEGLMLARDIGGRLEFLRASLAAIEPLASDVPVRQREKLLQRIRDAELSVGADDERVVKEIVFYADRSDVAEEITRLKSHFVHFAKFLEEDGEPVGRSLDFLIQEMNREITTLGNKAGDSAVSPLVVRFKAELEKIREQVQNIE